MTHVDTIRAMIRSEFGIYEVQHLVVQVPGGGVLGCTRNSKYIIKSLLTFYRFMNLAFWWQKEAEWRQM